MNDPEPAEEIVPRILKQYSERPRGWHIMNTPTGDVLVLSTDSAFQLKLIPLSPFEFTGAGIELSKSNKTIESIRSSPEFGLRPIDELDLQKLVNALGSSQSTGSVPEVQEILKRAPVSLEDLSSNKHAQDHILRGPVLMRPDLGSLSPELLEMQTLLDRSAQKSFRDRYPMRAGMYL
ncbi:MAG: hypothetical protein JW779_00870 [Candidatus Thorarchaeota archaeon]|nr:hypothetical protein [Candidatus Thorarchaeota archaeon]